MLTNPFPDGGRGEISKRRLLEAARYIPLRVLSAQRSGLRIDFLKISDYCDAVSCLRPRYEKIQKGQLDPIVCIDTQASIGGRGGGVEE